MKRFAEMVLRFRMWIIFSVAVLTLFFLYGLTRCTINSDLLSYLDPDEPSIKLFHRLGEEYGGNTTALVAVRSEDVFSGKTLSLIRDLTEAYRDIPGIASVVSLTNILDIRKIEDGIEVGKLIDISNMPQDDKELRKIKNYTLNKDLYSGKIVSRDGTIALIVCRLKPDVHKDKIGKSIKSLTERMKGNATVYYGGVPLQMIELNDLLIGDLLHLIPIVVLVVVVTLLVSFRSLRGVLLPLLNVIIASIWSMGLMGWLGIPLTIISNTMPVVLIAIGTAYGIHLLAKYREIAGDSENSARAVSIALQKVGLPIMATGLTTLVGFFSFTGAFLTSVTDFGVFSAIGVGVAMLISLTFIPSVLSYLPLKGNSKNKKSKNPSAKKQINVGKNIIKYRFLIILIFAVLIVVSSAFIPGMRTEVSMVNVFPEGSDVIRTDRLLKEQFGGGLGVQIVIQGNLKEPAVLDEMLRMERFLESLPRVSAAQSLADLICEMNKVMNGPYIVPETSEQVGNLLFMLEGEEMLDQLVNKDYKEGIIQANFSYDDTEDFLKTYTEIENYINNEFNNSLIYIGLDSVSKNVLSKTVNIRISNLAKKTFYDAIERGVENPPTIEQIRNAFTQFYEFKRVPVEYVDKNAILTRMRTFFYDEADIFLQTDDEIERAARALSGMLSGQFPDDEKIRTVLKQTIDPSYYQDDPESLDYTVESAGRILREMLTGYKIDWYVEKMLKELHGFSFRNKKLESDLKDNLWDLSRRIIPLPAGEIDQTNRPVYNIDVKQSGIQVVLTRFHHNLIRSQRNSLLIAFGLVILMMMIQFRSVLMGFIVIVPILFTVAFNFGFMSLVDAPLDLATMMIASIAIGIGIDYAIHFASRFRLEFDESGDKDKAVERTLRTTGIALIINALTVGLGFIILIGSNIVPVQRFGWLIALTMLVSVVTALTLLPAALYVAAEKIGLKK